MDRPDPGEGGQPRRALEVDGLSKSYGGTRALDGVSFGLAPGEVLAVLGQNGAGKSTLVKALAGVVHPDAGTVRVDGRPAELATPRAALRSGVVLIPQELAYVRDLTVAENICLGRWRASGRVVTRRRMCAVARPVAAELGLEPLLDAPMSSLSLAQCQRVEIAKALGRSARVLLLDEPTAALSDAEALALFDTLQTLRRRGVSMLYISHRLDEVLAITDRLLVLRDGAVVADRPTAGASRREVIQSMLGHARPARAPGAKARISRSGAAPMLALRGVSHRGPGLKDVSLTVERGEIVGCFGVAGGGHETLAMTLAGVFPHHDGELFLDGRPRPPLRTPRSARRMGIAYVPPERKAQGLILGQSIRRNLAFPQLRRLARAGVMRPRAEGRLVAAAAERTALRYRGGGQAVQELSGGNQQKVLLASRIFAASTLLVIQEPSRGVDVGARDEIHRLLRDVADQGQAVVFATSDVEEAVLLSDRLLVFRGGRLRATLAGETNTEAAALEAAGRDERESHDEPD